MLTRVRNAAAVRKATVLVPYSKLKHSLANILNQEGYVGKVSVIDSPARFRNLEIALKYDASGDSAIMEINRVSKPGQRIYTPSDKIPKANGGIGVTVLSTSHGLMADRQARKQKLGGEIICQVW